MSTAINKKIAVFEYLVVCHCLKLKEYTEMSGAGRVHLCSVCETESSSKNLFEKSPSLHRKFTSLNYGSG